LLLPKTTTCWSPDDAVEKHGTSARSRQHAAISICMRMNLYRPRSSDFEMKIFLKIRMEYVDKEKNILSFWNAAAEAYVQIRY
jgi:hypothetical protein